MTAAAPRARIAPVSETETETIDRVIASLSATFPLVPEGEIRDCVAAIYHRFADATVRTYIPVLVDRQARSAIMRSATGQGVPEHLVAG
jgi:hypothetical protein